MDQLGIGGMLAQRRRAQRMSQLDLSLEAGVSTRHLSFVETGRARPSREMVVNLCATLQVPVRERNDFLLAAGFAPLYRQTPLDDPQMDQALAALRMILRRNDPFPAVAFDRYWDMLMVNDAYAGFLATALPHEKAPAPLALIPAPRPNLLRLLLAPDGYRNVLLNWDAAAAAVLARVRREIVRDPDDRRRALLGEVECYPDVAALAREPAPLDVIVPVVLRAGDRLVRLLSTIAVLGAAEDITLQEVRIESFHPADEEAGETTSPPARGE